MYYYIHTSGLVKAQQRAEGVCGAFIPWEKGTIPPAEGKLSVQPAEGTQQTIWVCHSSAWLMIHPEQPGKEEASLSSFSALAALRRKSSMWSQCKRETSHLHCCKKLFPGVWTGIMYHNSRYGWNYGTNPATHGPRDIFFISRTQILYAVVASQMWKLQDKKHIWVTSWWVTAEPQAHLSSPTDPALECLQNPFFLLCFWMVKAAWLAILQGISRKWHAWCLHGFAHETTLICLVKHTLSQKSEEENDITKNSKILFCLEQTILTRLF